MGRPVSEILAFYLGRDCLGILSITLWSTTLAQSVMVGLRAAGREGVAL
jgi:hypothetical protein